MMKRAMELKQMGILLLYGINCKKNVWDAFVKLLPDYVFDIVEYPHEVTRTAICVDDLAEWVYEQYKNGEYDVVIGHSLGGIIALQLVQKYKMPTDEIILLDTSLKPAGQFYRNLMTSAHMEVYGEKVLADFTDERQYYTPELYKAVQDDFDYSAYVLDREKIVHAVYGDRGVPDYENRIDDLNLSKNVLEHLDIRFIPDACHMIMIENPRKLAELVKEILEG
jgi:pimeloyl-ACP methyl ester carboxylesterase